MTKFIASLTCTNGRRCVKRITRLPLLAALVAVALAMGLPSSSTAQETVSISGRVVNGTAGADIPVTSPC